MFKFSISVLQKQIDFYSWCLKEKVKSTRGIANQIKELSAAMEILEKEGKKWQK